MYKVDFFPLGRMRSSGRVLFVTSRFACFRVGGKYAFSEKPVADASAPCKQPMSDGSADGST